MSTHEDTSNFVDELARRRQQREAEGGEEQPLRERVRDEVRRSKRRHAAANRHRQRTDTTPPHPFGTDGAA